MANGVTDRGWANPANAKKHHYFHEGRSLCGRWAYTGDVYPDDQEIDNSEEDCAGCLKRVKQYYRKKA